MALNTALNEREQRILDFLVRDYIKTAEPISSSRIRDGLKLKESPATIRNIVSDLSEAGFFEQPHTSSGRVPTDAAYRYFVDYLMLEIEPSFDWLSKAHLISQREKSIGRIFSEAFNLLSLNSFDGERFGSQGFSCLLREPEFKDSESTLNAGYFMDNINEIADIYHKKSGRSPEVFIGEENPVECARELGVFYLESKYRRHSNTILLVGPKRMDYERIWNYVSSFLDEF